MKRTGVFTEENETVCWTQALTLYKTPRRSAFDDRVEEWDSFGSNPTERRRTIEIDRKVLQQRSSSLRRKIAQLRTHRERTRT